MTRLLAFIATLLLGAAASAHVPRVAANFAPTIEYATAVETHAQSAPCAAKTARPARAKIAAQESACASALTHCRVWRNPTSSQNRTSSRGVYAYTAFGENDPAGTSGNTSGSTDNNYRYTGEQLDPNLGFYYLRARYMDPRQGRFVGMDPWSGDFNDPLSLHKYIFANQVPSALGDPSGESATLIGVGVSAGIGAVMGVASTHLTNVALGRASTVGELAMGAAVGAALGAGGYFCPSCLIPLGLYGVASSGALVADVWTGEGTTMKQKAAAAVLLITSIGGTAAGQRVASNIRQLHGFGLLHDRSVRGISRLLTWAGVNHRLEVYVRNPFYRRGRRYDIVVQVPGTGRYIGVEYKSSMSEYLYPKANQSSADHFVKTQGGEMFGSAAGPYGGASVTGVVRINGGRNLVSTCSAGIDCEE